MPKIMPDEIETAFKAGNNVAYGPAIRRGFDEVAGYLNETYEFYPKEDVKYYLEYHTDWSPVSMPEAGKINGWLAIPPDGSSYYVWQDSADEFWRATWNGQKLLTAGPEHISDKFASRAKAMQECSYHYKHKNYRRNAEMAGADANVRLDNFADKEEARRVKQQKRDARARMITGLLVIPMFGFLCSAIVTLMEAGNTGAALMLGLVLIGVLAIGVINIVRPRV